MSTWSEITLGGKPCVVADHNAWPLARRANSFYLPLGHEPGVAHVVMLDKDIYELAGQVNGTSSLPHLPLVFKSGPPNVTLTFQKMHLGRAVRLTPAPEDAKNAPMLVTLYDKRILAKQFSPPLTFDICASATDTWAGVAQKLWESMTFLGAWPTLPYTPYGKPRWLKWLYLPTWQALTILLGKIQCAVKYDPFTDAFTIVKLGAAQSITYDESTETFRTRTLIGKVTMFPEKVRVRFPGATETLNTSKTGAFAGTFQSFIEDRDPADGTEQTNRATEIRDNWLLDQDIPSEKYVYHRLYKDVLPGGTVKSVLWRNYGPSPNEDAAMRGGFRTELLTHPGLPTPIIDPDQPLPALFAKSKTGGIDALASDVMGSADVDVYESDITHELADASFDIEATNIASSEVGEEKYLVIEPVQGRYVVTVEDCG